MKTHVIIIRMHYPVWDKRWPWRLEYFRKEVLPRLIDQTDQNFDIAIRCNPAHAETLRKLSHKIRTFQVRHESERVKITNNKKYFIDFVKWHDVIGLPKYDIQSGLDSDDLVATDYIENIHKIISENDQTKSLHISFQPEVFNTMTKKTYGIGIEYGPKKGSAFFSIYQPNKENYIFAYEYSHLKLWKHFDKSITLPAEKCWASVHGHNFSTKIYG
jgi:hypothetical protein